MYVCTKTLISCQKSASRCALICIVEGCGAIVSIWCVVDENIMSIATSKYWATTAVAPDRISFLFSSQAHFCWSQTTWVDEAE